MNKEQNLLKFITLVLYRIVVPITLSFFVCNTLMFFGGLAGSALTGRSIAYFSFFPNVVSIVVPVWLFRKTWSMRFVEIWLHTMSACGSDETEEMADPRDIFIADAVQGAVNRFVENEMVVRTCALDVLKIPYVKEYLTGVYLNIAWHVCGDAIRISVAVILENRLKVDKLHGFAQAEEVGSQMRFAGVALSEDSLRAQCSIAGTCLKTLIFQDKLSESEWENVRSVLFDEARKLIEKINTIRK